MNSPPHNRPAMGRPSSWTGRVIRGRVRNNVSPMPLTASATCLLCPATAMLVAGMYLAGRRHEAWLCAGHADALLPGRDR